MKGRVIALDSPEERGFTAALVVDGRLEDLILDPPKRACLRNPGDICLVRVKRKLQKSGAFCEMAGGQDGFLKDARNVSEGERILAQVVSLPEPGKAVTLTTRLLVKGPRLILTPGAPGINVSRKIGNKVERDRLVAAIESAIAEYDLPAGIPSYADSVGVIIRSAAKGEPDVYLSREFNGLLAELRGAKAQLRASNDKLIDGKGGGALGAVLTRVGVSITGCTSSTSTIRQGLVGGG